MILKLEPPKIDYSRVVDRTQLDFCGVHEKCVKEGLCGYHYKFRVWDYVLENNLIASKNYEAINLWNDKTIYAYSLLKLNNSPITLRPFQDLILNDDYRFRIFCAANQIGKSLGLDVDASVNFLKDHGHPWNGAIVSKSLPQSSKQMRRIKSILRTSRINYKDESGSSDSMSVITLDIYGTSESGKKVFKYSNELICAPCTEGLLGYDLHDLYLDEFDFWDVDKEYFYYQIAEPRTYETRGNITIFSNPNGQEGFMYVLWNQTYEDGRLKWHCYNFNVWDKPGYNEKMFQEDSYGKPRAVVESTLLAIFTRGEGAFLSSDEIAKSFDKNLERNKELIVGRQTFWFLDVGAVHDRSCLVGGYIEPNMLNERFIDFYIFKIHHYPQAYPVYRVIGSESDLRSSDGWHDEKCVKDYLYEYSEDGKINPVFGCDVTGNSGLSPLFQATGIYPIDITFSGPQKSAMYQRYQYLMQKVLIHRIKHSEWEKQASDLTVTKSARGYWLINSGKDGSGESAKNKRIPDDTQDATVGFIYLSDNPVMVKPSLTFLGYDKVVEPKKEFKSQEDLDLDDIEEANRLNGRGVFI